MLAALRTRLGGADATLARDDAEDPALRATDEAYYLGGDRAQGLKVDLTHKTVADGARLVEDVALRHDAHPLKLAVLHSLGRAEALRGADLLATWRARGSPMPIPVREALAAEQRPLPALWTLEMTAARADPILYQEQALTLARRLLRTLYAALGRYPPLRFKHLRAELAALEGAPARTESWIRALLGGVPEHAIPAAEGLGDAVLEIAAARLPGFDAAAARAELRYRRARHAEPPPSIVLDAPPDE